jgi:hypothetical protein
MRHAAGAEAWDRVVPLVVLPYATWTVYVHLVVVAQASFTTLLRWLPLVLLLAAAATTAWFRLRDPAQARQPVPAAPMRRQSPVLPWAALAFAIGWVALLGAGLPYAAFWWVALLATGLAWAWHLRAGSDGTRATSPGNPAWIVPCVVAAAILVVLVANRPDVDDAFHLSIPATLLRAPGQPVLLHDTMYRLQDAPILLPFYRLGNYDVLVAVLARATGIDHLLVAYLLLPSLFAAIGVMSWIYLLRRIVPGRWVLVLPLLFGCVLALGEVHRAYGNFAFVRLFQGKAVLATCMVPAIAGAALVYARHGGIRHWLLLLAAQVAALGISASAVFVAPAAAALGLAGGWSADAAHSRRFLAGLLASAYVLAAAWLVATGARGEHVLSVAGSVPMPGVVQILEQTWGRWSTRVLLVALLAAWAFVRDPLRARYLSAGAFCFLLVALDPYAIPFVGDHSIGVKTYWRLTWALPLPFFLAVMVDAVLARVAVVKPRAIAAGACLALLALGFAFAARFGTLRQANAVAFGMPGPKVPPLEFSVARRLVDRVPEGATVLAPEAVASWLPVFVAHPRPIAVRHMYLSLAFTPAETAQRSNLMRYVEGRHRPADARQWFARSLRRSGVAAVVYRRDIPWSGEIESTLRAQGWKALASGRYGILVQGRQPVVAHAAEGADRRGRIHHAVAAEGTAAVAEDAPEPVRVEAGR